MIKKHNDIFSFEAKTRKASFEIAEKLRAEIKSLFELNEKYQNDFLKIKEIGGSIIEHDLYVGIAKNYRELTKLNNSNIDKKTEVLQNVLINHNNYNKHKLFNSKEMKCHKLILKNNATLSVLSTIVVLRIDKKMNGRINSNYRKLAKIYSEYNELRLVITNK